MKIQVVQNLTQCNFQEKRLLGPEDEQDITLKMTQRNFPDNLTLLLHHC